MSDVREPEDLSEDELFEEQADEEVGEAPTEYIEFLGWKPYGTEFISEHSVPKKHMKDTHDIKSTKDVVWRKGANGRMLVPVADIDPDVVDYLVTDEAFKKVTL